MKNPEQLEKIRYLSRYIFLQKEIDRKIDEIEAWNSRLYRITPVLSDMPSGGGNGKNDKMITGIMNVLELQETLKARLATMVRTRNEIENAIHGVENYTLQEILKCRYMDGKTWEEIAASNHYAWSHTHRLHEKALEQIKMG